MKEYLIRGLFEDTIVNIVSDDNDNVVSVSNDKIDVIKLNDTWIAVSKQRRDYIKHLIKETLKEQGKSRK
jgi:hypothetical protein